jgi:type II secretory pathway pseudopilin PulG
MRGFDGQPSQVAEQDIDADFRKGAIVAYRAVGSNPARFRQHFDNFKNGDYYAGHGIYGHGTYVAFASKGTTTHSRLDAAMAASQYGSGVMRMSLVPGKVIKQSTHTQQINRLDADFRKWAQKTRAAANPIPTKAEIQAEVQKIWQNNTVNFSPGGTFGTFDVRLTSGSSNPSKLVGLVTKAGNGYQYMDSGLNAVDVRTQKKAIDGVLSVYAEQEIMKRQIPQVKEAERRIRRTKEVLFGDAASGNQTSGRFATIQGVDAIKLDNAYDKSYMLLLNRSAVRVQKTPGQLGSV